MSNTETEVRFLEIDKDALVKKLIELGAVDKGEVMLEEVIIYDKDLKWQKENRLIRVRKSGDNTRLTYKHHHDMEKGESIEIEQGITDLEKAVQLFESIGLIAHRRQQKKRHTLTAFGVTFDIDTWPRIPTYVEIEGDSHELLKLAAQKVNLEWPKAIFKDSRWVIHNVYNIDMDKLRWFTFDRFE